MKDGQHKGGSQCNVKGIREKSILEARLQETGDLAASEPVKHFAAAGGRKGIKQVVGRFTNGGIRIREGDKDSITALPKTKQQLKVLL
ncbi:hypothetical protein Droror1_Dr00028044 [Drosera rotundifolia]